MSQSQEVQNQAGLIDITNKNNLSIVWPQLKIRIHEFGMMFLFDHITIMPFCHICKDTSDSAEYNSNVTRNQCKLKYRYGLVQFIVYSMNLAENCYTICNLIISMAPKPNLVRVLLEKQGVKGAFIVCCNAAALPVYRLLIYRSSTQRTAPQLHCRTTKQQSAQRDGSTTTATYHNAAAVNYEHSFKSQFSMNFIIINDCNECISQQSFVHHIASAVIDWWKCQFV